MEQHIKTQEKCSIFEQKEIDLPQSSDDNTCQTQSPVSQKEQNNVSFFGLESAQKSGTKSISYTTLIAVICLSISLCQIACEAIGFEVITSIIVDISVTLVSILVCLGVVRYDKAKTDAFSLQESIKNDIQNNLKISSEQKDKNQK